MREAITPGLLGGGVALIAPLPEGEVVAAVVAVLVADCELVSVCELVAVTEGLAPYVRLLVAAGLTSAPAWGAGPSRTHT